jgi:2-polyprenyl-6-methoxyphenol hydroxylase-like FAD-dependent oxidoreductase
MQRKDIVIVGGGLAGSIAAAMLGRAGFDVAIFDPHKAYPPDFRSEKLDERQLRLLDSTGLAERVVCEATAVDELWIARFGRLVERRRKPQYGIPYDALVNAVRAQIPNGVEAISEKARSISTGVDRQTVHLSNGGAIESRLIILATGLNKSVCRELGVGREELSRCHSISVGFNIRPRDRAGFEFPALTYYGEHTGSRVALFTAFPIGSKMRANIFVYRDARDPWLQELRHSPEAVLFSVMPGLRKMVGTFEAKDMKIRPVNLHCATGYRQAGVVLIGDAFSTSCPAAGTGISKVLTDTERLCNLYIPRWFATSGMGVDKIAAFYRDPEKLTCDAESTAKAFNLRSASLSDSFSWRARRWAKFAGQRTAGQAVQYLRRAPLF